MVPADKILAAAEEHDADIIGLSGLITPSLDEMVHVAKEMERKQMNLPLLIGGATTSKQHTAVKIAPVYRESVTHVLDASRAVGVVSTLLDPETRARFEAELQDDQATLRDRYENKRAKPLHPLSEARELRGRPEFATDEITTPTFLGARRIEEEPLADIVPYIDWTFFFAAWELRGRYPAILEHPDHGEAARELYENARAMLDEIVTEGLLTARAVYGFWPAEADGDDIALFADASRSDELARFPMLRQQTVKENDNPLLSLADYVAPAGADVQDHVGAFAVSIHGAEELAARHEREGDDYSAIMVKALADRLAEAFAERLHERARRDWGYARDESLSNEELIAEGYRGIRPAFGYPACPDHTPKRTLFRLLDAEDIGMSLSDNLAMMPASSVSGLYIGHPEARYFAIGRLGRDQVEDYAARAGLSVPEAERWLAPSLGYEPSDESG